MPELDRSDARFEARLAASLQRLAGDAPTDVDPVALTASLARRGHRGTAAWPWAWERPFAAAFRLALVAAALALLAYSAAVLAPRLLAAPVEPLLHGSVDCDGPAWTTGSVSGRTLTCSSALPDPRLRGPLAIAIGEPARLPGGAIADGSITLDGQGAHWSGALHVTIGPNGVAVADGVLTDRSTPIDGAVLTVHLLSSDGVHWGAIVAAVAIP